MGDTIQGNDYQTKYISSKDAAALFGVTNDHISRLCRQKKIRGVVQDGLWLVDKESVSDFFTAKGISPRPVSVREIIHRVAKYISSKDAAALFGVTNDHISRLCRQKKIRGVVQDGLWLVDKESVSDFFTAKGISPSPVSVYEILQFNPEALGFTEKITPSVQEKTVKEPPLVTGGEAKNPANPISRSGPTLIAHPASPKPSRVPLSGVLAIVGVIFISVFFIVLSQNAIEQHASLISRASPSRVQNVAAIGGGVPSYVANSIGTFFGNILRVFGWDMGQQGSVYVQVKPTTRPAPLSPPTAVASRGFASVGSGVTTPSSVVNNTYNNTYNTTNNETHNVYNNATYSLPAISGITTGDLDKRLQQFAQSLQVSQFTPMGPSASGGVANQIALTQRIDSLSGTLLTNVRVNGVTGLTSADLPDLSGQYLAVSGGTLSGLLNSTYGGTSTFSGGLGAGVLSVSSTTATSTFASSINLTGGCLAVNGACLQTGTSTPAGGSNGQIQFNNGGVFGGVSNFSYDTSSGNLGIGTTTPTARLAIVASSTDTTSTLLSLASSTGASVFSVDNIGGITFVSATGQSATTTSFFSTTSSSTYLFSTDALLGTATITSATTTSLFASLFNAVTGTITNLTTTSATATNFFATTASSTNLFSQSAQFGSLAVNGALSQSGLATFTNGFLSHASSTITSGLFSMNGGASTTNFTATGLTILGNATTTNLFSTTASSTNLFAQAASFGSLTLPSIANSLLSTNASGVVSATTTIGWNLLKGPASSIFAFDESGNPTATTSIGVNYLSGILGIANGGTATGTQVTNGVNYFDGTRITSGTALTFNGTNLGIGTTTPQSLLDIGGFIGSPPASVSSMVPVSYVSSDVNGLSGIVMGNINTNSNADFRYLIKDTNDNYITMSMPGVNTTASILGQAKNTTAYLFANGTVSPRNLTIGTVSANDLIFGTNNAENMRIKSGGNIGIGTTSPSGILEVGNTSASGIVSNFTNGNSGTGAYTEVGVRNGYTAANNADALRLLTFGTGWTSTGGYVQDGAALEAGVNLAGGLSMVARNSAGVLRFYTGGQADSNERMRIDSTGNVGIGTSTPDSILTVNGNSTGLPSVPTAGTNIHLGGANSGQLALVMDGFAAAPVITARRAQGTAASPSALNFAGFNIFDIQTAGYGATGYSTPVNTFAIQTDGAWTDASQPTRITFGTTASGATSVSERMRIDSSGNVGIGTTTLYSKLTAWGTGSLFEAVTNSSSTVFSIGQNGATTTNFAISNITNSLLSTNANGSVVATTSIGVNYLSGILPIANGGTATGTQVTNGVNYFDGTRITSGTALTFDGTSLTKTDSTSGSFSLMQALVDGTARFIVSDAAWAGHRWDIGVGPQFLTASSTLAFKDVTGGGVRMVLDGTGNVGIGTTTPSYSLDVNGFINVDGTAGGYKMAGNTILYASSTNQNTLVGQAGAPLQTSGTGQFNTAVGYLALSSATSTNSNTAIGRNVLSLVVQGGDANTAVGRDAMAVNTTGTLNSALGYFALNANTTGSSNSAFGRNALSANTTGGSNVAFGATSLLANITGSNNVVAGVTAFLNATSSSNNTAVGFNTGRSVSGATGAVGGTNSFFGYQAGYDVTTGSNNTILGQFTTTGSGITTGSNNILIGQGVRAGLSQTGSNQLNIGNLVFGTGLGSDATLATGNIGIGTTSPLAKLHVLSSGTAIASSDNNSEVVFEGPNHDFGAGAKGNVFIVSNSTAAADAGGSLTFGGKFSGDLAASLAMIKSGRVGTFGGYLAFGTRPDGGNPTERVRIDSQGNVGIGTTSPYSKLTTWGTGSLFEAVTNSSSTVFSIGQNGATTTNFAISNITNSLLSTNASGAVVATTTIGWNLIKGPASSIFAFDASGNPTATTSIGVNYLSGILPIANGGTATSTQVTNGVNYFDGTRITSGTSLTFDGTTFSTPLFNSTQTSGTSTIASGQGFTIGSTQLVLQQGSGNVGIGATALGTSRLRVSSNGSFNDKVLEVTAAGVGGGQTGPFYGGYFDVVSNNNSTAGYGLYAQALLGGGGNKYGVYGSAQVSSSNVYSYGLYGLGTYNSGAVGSYGTGLYADATTTGSSMLATTYGAYITNSTSFGANAYGAYINAGAGATNAIPLAVASDGVEAFRVASTGNVGIGTTSPQEKLSIQGGNFFQTGGASGQIYTPATLGGVDLGIGVGQSLVGGGQNISVVGNTMYLVNASTTAGTDCSTSDQSNCGFRIYDISTSTPHFLGGVSFNFANSHANSIAVAGQYAYLSLSIGSGTCNATTPTGCEFRIYDVSNPSFPTFKGGLDLAATGETIVVSGHYAYMTRVSVSGNDFLIIDIADPTNPVIVGGLDLGTTGIGLRVQGNYAYITIATVAGNDLVVADISNPVAPGIVGGMNLGNNGRSVYVSGNYAYVGKDSGGVTGEFMIYDISNPAAIATTTELNLGVAPQSIFVSGRYAYLGLSSIAGTCSSTTITGCDFRVYDVSDPYNITPVGGVDFTANVQGVFVAGHRAFAGLASASGNDLVVLDITGAEVQSLLAHSLEAGNLNLRNDLVSNGHIFGDTINAGNGGIYSNGGIFSYVASSTATTPIAGLFMGGNVGIGTSTPWARLSVQTADNISTPQFVVASSSAASFVVAASGNVGVGTTTPQSLLHLYGGSSGGTTGSGAFTIEDDTAVFLQLMTPAGNQEQIRFGDADNSGAGLILYHHTDDRMAFYTAAAERLRITSSGDIGINDTTPSYSLDVNGFINTDGTTGGYKQAGNTVLYASTTNWSLAVGASAAAGWMSASSSPFYSVAVGQGALGATPTSGAAVYNTAVGALNPLSANTTGASNSAFGVQALRFNTTGSANTASGVNALYSNTTGTTNTAHGVGALFSNTTGSNNAAVGYSALYSNVTGGTNVAMGYDASYYNSSATSTIAIGYLAGMGTAAFSNQGGTYLGYAAGRSLATGSDYNTLLGYDSGYGITTGSRNVLLGQSTIAASYNQVTTGDNNIAIGNDVAVPSATASNQLVIGNLIYGTGLSGTGSTVSTGNIGIGTTTPVAKLGISQGGANSTNGVQLLTGGTSNYGAYSLGRVGNEAYWGVAAAANHWFTGTAAGDIALGSGAGKLMLGSGITDVAAGTLAMTITGGNVGIGTTSPLVLLDISKSSAGTTLTSNSSAAFSITNPNTTTNNFSDLLFSTIDASGNTAVGSKISGVFTSHTASAVSGGIAFLTNNAGTLSEAMRILPTNLVGIGITAPTSMLHVSGTQPTSVSSGNGTAATSIFNAAGITGGVTTDTGTRTGGAGSALTLTLGTGGTATAADVLSTGGAGGTFTMTGGVGGAASVAGTGNNTGGAGSPFTWTAGTGGAATNANATPGTQTGGAGGAITLRAGTGGTGLDAGGAGGLLTLSGGTAAAATSSAGGGVTITGAAGATTGSGGAGGALTFTAGAAGGDNSVSRQGGAIALTAGASKGQVSGGGITLTLGAASASSTGNGGSLTFAGGTGGTNTNTGTASGGVGSAFTWTLGTGGTATGADVFSTGGAGGTFTMTGGAGGAASVAGTGDNRGGAGSPFTWTGGTGGVANGNTTGNNTGGAGGAFTWTAGTGGAATNANATPGTRTGGAGGAITLRAGTGGVGTDTGGSGGTLSLLGGTAAAATSSAGGGVAITGAAGGTTGSGGAGGAITLTGGLAGGDNSVARAGGAISLTAGASKGQNTGGGISLTTGAASASSTSAGGTLTLLGGAGGTNTNIGTAAGGIGAAFTFQMGAGGTATAADVLSTGGAGGTFTMTGGVGGAASVAGTGNNTGGAGSPFTWNGGTGGAASGNTTGNNTGGAGGAFTWTAGTGGAATNANATPGTRTGGNGGAITINAGAGGVGTDTGGNGGLITISGGAAAAATSSAGGGVSILGDNGSSVGSGGAGGALTFTAGAAGGDNSVARAGGAVLITAGASKGQSAGGLITLTTGAAGASSTLAGGAFTIAGGLGGTNTNTGTAVGGAGAGFLFTLGTGGTATGADVLSTGGVGGTFFVTGGVGGAASVAGTGDNTGGAGSAFTWTAGTGGAASGNTTGANTAGAGGAVTLSAGTGGAATNANATPGTRTGGAGGALTLNAGIGGAGTDVNGVGGAMIFKTAQTTSLTEQMRITNTGLLGIGTTTPFWKLTVASSTGPQIALTDTTAGSNAWTFRSISNTLYIATSTATATSTTPAVTITPNGLFGIATSSPGALLSAGGNILGAGTLALTGTTGTTTIAAGQGFTIGGSQFVLQQGSGNVGIGTTSPTNLLHIVAPSGALPVLVNADPTSGGRGIRIGTSDYVLNTTSGSTMQFNMGAGSGSTFGKIDVTTSGATVAGDLILASNGGNVGIGTTTPHWKLTVSNASGPQLSLTDGSLTSNTWTMRNAGGQLFFATSTYTATSSISALRIDANGNLIVHGSSGADCTIGNGTSATNCSSSDERLKDNISTLTATSGLSAIKRLNPVSFYWNAGMVANNAPTSTQFGFIAQQVKDVFPNLVEMHASGRYTLDYQGLFAPIVTAIQELSTEVTYVASSTEAIASATTTPLELTTASSSVSTTTPWIASFSLVPQWLKDGINGIADPLVHVFKNTVYAATGIFDSVFAKDIYATNITADKVTAKQKLCVGITCVTEVQLQALLAGAAGATAAGTTTTTTTTTSTGSVAPIISVNGNNPSSIAVGAVYSDLGATITGPTDALNLGISAIVDGGATTTLGQISIDTSVPGTHSIRYFATTADGVQGSATRTVVVHDPTTTTPPAPETTPTNTTTPSTDTSTSTPSTIDTSTSSSTDTTATDTSSSTTTTSTI